MRDADELQIFRKRSLWLARDMATKGNCLTTSIKTLAQLKLRAKTKRFLLRQESHRQSTVSRYLQWDDIYLCSNIRLWDLLGVFLRFPGFQNGAESSTRQHDSGWWSVALEHLRSTTPPLWPAPKVEDAKTAHRDVEKGRNADVMFIARSCGSATFNLFKSCTQLLKMNFARSSSIDLSFGRSQEMFLARSTCREKMLHATTNRLQGFWVHAAPPGGCGVVVVFV